MKKIKFFIPFLTLLFLLLCQSVSAQVAVNRSKDIIRIGGKEYYMHLVKQGQTLYGISEAYNVTIEEIENLNPEVKNGLKTGHVLGIPVRPMKEEEPKVEPVITPKEEPQVEPIIKPKEEPKEEPKVEPVIKPKDEPKDEPKVEPVIKPKEEPKEEPKVEPMIKPKEEPQEEPKVEPVIKPKEEPKVEPKVEPVIKPKEEPKEEPKVEPVIKPKEEPKEEPKVEPVIKPKEETIVEQGSSNSKQWYSASGRVVQKGEDLYDLAKEYGIDIADFKRVNPGLSEEPMAGTKVVIPSIANENDYIIHNCVTNERVSSLLKRWKVDEDVFRKMNISVGSHVFVNQVVLIPIDRITDFYWMPQNANEEEPVVIEEVVDEPEPEVSTNWDFEEELSEIPVCVASPENATRRYNVALMIPLYLNNIGDISISKDNVAKVQKSRSMSFLQFYEGFMMAAEALEKQGLKLDLTVIDVTDNVSTAERALTEIDGKELDLIVGPFFGKSFNVIEEYAKQNGIVMVNPLSNRGSVIEDNPNVVKVKPGNMGMVFAISNLIKNDYSDANVFIVSREKAEDSTFLSQLEHHLNLAVNEEVTIPGNEFLQFARDESVRLEMGSRIVPTVDVEGQVYSTSDFENGSTNEVVLSNTVKRYAYSEIGEVKSQLSGVRDNVIIAYGDDNVFATQMLNSLTKSADRFPITLICAPDWARFEKLLVDNLLKMNAIYVSDFFVDYESQPAKDFVLRFRRKYVSEPQEYAFEGYDVGYYFLSALMQYGNEDLMGCLHCYEASLLHTNYRFYYKNYLRPGWNDGKENLYWSVYQYDQEEIQLVPLDPFKKNVEDE